MGFSTVTYGTEGQQVWTSASQGRMRLGTKMVFQDGREFVFAQAGATNLGAGQVMSSAAVTAGHTVDMPVAVTAAVGDTTLSITNVTTAVTANMYDEGYMFVNDQTGVGHIYQIKSHTVDATTSGTVVLTFEEGSALRTILTAGTSQVGLRKHPCDYVVVYPTTEVGVQVGVTTTAVTGTYYCWLQTRGSACVLTSGTVILGMQVQTSTAAGAVSPKTASGDDIPVVGHVQTVGADGEYSLVDLRIG